MGARYLTACLCFLSFFLSYINSHINNSPTSRNSPTTRNSRDSPTTRMTRCKSAPDLRTLYNDTIYMPINDNNKNLVPYSKYKAIIFNRYRRNIYLRSKEKYTLP